MSSFGGDGLQASRNRLTRATFAIYYQSEWLVRGLADPQQMDARVRPMTLRDATEALRQETRDDDREFQRAAVSLSLAQLARATAAGRPRPLGWREAVDSLAIRWHTLQRAAYETEEARDEKLDESIFPDLFDDRVLLEDRRFMRAFARLNRVRAQRRRVRHFAVSWSYGHRVSDICVSIECDKTLDELQGLLDPRNWRRSVPLVWTQSDELQVDTGFIDGNPPQPQPYPSPPDPYSGKFYEVALFGLSPIELASYRNILNIDIDVDLAKRTKPLPPIVQAPGCGVASNDRLEFTYSQDVCVTSSMKFIGAFPNGGIDVDTGFGRCERLPDGSVRITARKRARFDQPRDRFFNAIYNDIAAVYLKLLIETFVLYGAIGN
jgi:hypothetical protein